MNRNYNQLYTGQDKLVAIWLGIMCFAIICMISIGGLTRLTHSGLSITEWNPVSGILPPLTDSSWQEEFAKYKKSPEYITYNSGMSLSEFKPIYLLEFIHRIAGRITGLAYIIPLMLFIAKGYFRAKDIALYSLVTLLFLMQGLMGWYMVKSGLINSPHVSHYRLATHLLLAFIIYSILFWQLMKNSFDILLISRMEKIKPATWLLITSIVILMVQIIFGAFTAGLNAGLVYNSFPYMGESFIPHEINFSSLGIKSLEDPVFVQFIHRMTAYGLAIVMVITCLYLYKMDNMKLNKCASYILCALAFQLLAGIITLIYAVPVTAALIHQVGAVLLLSMMLWALFLIKSA